MFINSQKFYPSDWGD